MLHAGGCSGACVSLVLPIYPLLRDAVVLLYVDGLWCCGGIVLVSRCRGSFAVLLWLWCCCCAVVLCVVLLWCGVCGGRQWDAGAKRGGCLHGCPILLLRFANIDIVSVGYLHLVECALYVNGLWGVLP